MGSLVRAALKHDLLKREAVCVFFILFFYLVSI